MRYSCRKKCKISARNIKFFQESCKINLAHWKSCKKCLVLEHFCFLKTAILRRFEELTFENWCNQSLQKEWDIIFLVKSSLYWNSNYLFGQLDSNASSITNVQIFTCSHWRRQLKKRNFLVVAEMDYRFSFKKPNVEVNRYDLTTNFKNFSGLILEKNSCVLRRNKCLLGLAFVPKW